MAGAIFVNSLKSAHASRILRPDGFPPMNLARVQSDFDEIVRLGDEYESGSARFDAFVCSLVPVQARRLLDVGCGTGRLTAALLQDQRECVGVDVSPEMIRRAQRHSEAKAGLSFLCGDFLGLALGLGAFDCVVTVAALHHMPEAVAIPRLKQLLRPGGRLIVHDLRTSTGLLDELGGWSMLAHEAARRFIRTGWPMSPTAVRRAWARHGARETYLTLDDVTKMASQFLPGASISKQPWRYTIVWDKSV